MTVPQRSGRLPDCPEWCEVNHAEPLDPVHSRSLGEIRYEAARLAARVVWDPRGLLPLWKTPHVAVVGWRDETLLEKGGPAALNLSASDAGQFAGLMDVLDHDELAVIVRQGSALLTEGNAR